MMRWKTVCCVVLLVLGVCVQASAWPSVYPRGVTIHDPEKAQDGYTLFVNQANNSLRLIDMEGIVIKDWPGFWATAEVLPNGHIMGMSVDEKGVADGMKEIDWEGNEIWSYKADNLHHDFYVKENGNVVMLARESVPDEVKKKMKDQENANSNIEGDYFFEVNREGKIVWEWHLYDHLDINVWCPKEKRADWMHTNTVELLPDTPLGREDKRFRKGNILGNCRNLDLVFVVDQDTGEIVWRWGAGVISHAHMPTMVSTGNIVVFDNGLHRFGGSCYSQIVEVNPKTEEVVWRYRDPHDQQAFFSAHGAGQERLPNGNTLICSPVADRLFEVTPDNEIVWEYINPRGVNIYRAKRVPRSALPKVELTAEQKEAQKLMREMRELAQSVIQKGKDAAKKAGYLEPRKGWMPGEPGRDLGDGESKSKAKRGKGKGKSKGKR